MKSKKLTARLSSDALIDAALRIADAEGLEALSMRRLASEFDVAVMTLYGCFASKEELLDRMADTVLEKLEFPVVASGDWSVQVRSIMHSYRNLLLTHPSIVRLATTRRVVTRSQARSIEATVALLRTAGFDGPAAVRGYAALFTYTVGFVAYEIPRTRAQSEDEQLAEQDEVVTTLKALAMKYTFPHVAELAEDLYEMAHPDTFEYGLDRLLDGLKAELARSGCHRVARENLP